MATYYLTVNLDQRWVKQYQNSSFQLCFALGMTSSTQDTPVNFNVVAAVAPKLANSVTFSWTENYAIAASDQSVQGGTTVVASTAIVPISFGSRYTVDAKFLNTYPTSDPSAPTNGFRFQVPANTIASAVVYKPVGVAGSTTSSPFYITNNGPIPQGMETLIPVTVARVWFQSSVTGATMIDEYASAFLDVDLTSAPGRTATCNYSALGAWGLGPLIN